MSKYNFYEFFAGGGMARAGLGSEWKCLFANDFDEKKAETYKRNWGEDAFKGGDIALLNANDLPDHPDLVWGSFPCQDLSHAGAGAGLNGDRSGTFWPFWELIGNLAPEDRMPALVVLENVCGTLTSHKGEDFKAINRTFREHGYRLGCVVVDASLFVPQSRPRVFMIGVKEGVNIPRQLISGTALDEWSPRSLKEAYEALDPEDKENWLWWNIAPPAKRNIAIEDIIEEMPSDVKWHTPAETKKLLGMMSPLHKERLEAIKKVGKKTVGTVYRRMRPDGDDGKVQRAEVRFDGMAGCLRTPSGGSSRQTILVVEGPKVRSRLLSGRETARLMGLDDTYILPAKYNETYHLTGDGVAVPVVRYLAESLFEPILNEIVVRNEEAA